MELTDTTPCSKRGQIIEAAVQEFQDKGFAAASMDTISARAGVSKRTLYKYFESKHNLFQSIVATLSERITDTLDIRYDSSRDIRTQLTDLAWAEGRLLSSPAVMAMSRMIISETLRSPVLAAEVQGKIDKKSAFVAMLRAAHDDGALDVADADTAADEFIALIKAKAFWPVVLGEEMLTNAQMEAVVKSSVDMMIARYTRA
ncbi:TetR/AcrR family transcriptional regulator [Roseobacter sp. MH60115]|uniref:TetR/AcrR family transcriptional regulator n=1 Tax=Roseobacter sp. MH60115 TaxID=2785324 RepID=UPI0018A24F93|nr:TetR/AcrR family transcriptional regulator [Roseobacter sp. MH60115]